MTSVLVVDDEPTLRRLIGHYLAGAGYAVTCAENGLVAWQLIQAHEFDVILTDVRMPVMTGLELLDKVRAYVSATPIILISGSEELRSSEELRNRADAIARGAHDLLAKPV